MSVEEHDHEERRGPEMLTLNGASCTTDGHCITCSDEALPARVLSFDQVTGLAMVAIGDATAEVDVSLVDAVQAGQWVLIHGGVAIAELEEAQ